MATLATCSRWAFGIALLLVSPAVLIFAVPFGAGATGDLLKLAGMPAGLSATLAVCIAALVFARRARVR
ncbi:MAG: hypothetical protein ACREFB_07480, partial [Stellaceae bacterium]